ncbi:hypothetical protein EJ05DRAFT_247789 [Pseudovirgaria hyperparasitica]|uniref:Uncharacterized protein n=1 Tax=Pseudovirgaria hyperparasitica TaxID=470096 RepID=A0A6A6WE12_9PEZI|nr:uncharacterized protein EJ05DRAFT_247789 [Pseudovirgaria hyperparasitica]KAF2760953.1 hypothetical protein EJ05DRAFT_247789 [Pseudovirgaria hyperparasitica]
MPSPPTRLRSAALDPFFSFSFSFSLILFSSNRSLLFLTFLFLLLSSDRYHSNTLFTFLETRLVSTRTTQRHCFGAYRLYYSGYITAPIGQLSLLCLPNTPLSCPPPINQPPNYLTIYQH